MKGRCTEEKATKQLIQIGFQRQKQDQTPFNLSFSNHKFQKRLNNFTSMHSYRELKQHTDIPQHKPQQRINLMRVEKKAKMYELPFKKLNPLANLSCIQGTREQKQCPISSRRQKIVDRQRKKTRNFSYQFRNAINQNKKSKDMNTESKQQLQSVNLSLPKIENLAKPTERKALLLGNIISKRITKNE